MARKKSPTLTEAEYRLTTSSESEAVDSAELARLRELIEQKTKLDR